LKDFNYNQFNFNRRITVFMGIFLIKLLRLFNYVKILSQIFLI